MDLNLRCDKSKEGIMNCIDADDKANEKTLVH
eukprot:CAMPEP_0176028864 /NCGR_PEP_ID=MMETSP0120_2-20121206/14174_1 /TAXON_ID=160619 /ORGANISM="Kryptoperidinium foliaceum, Strain CCMP 1326" /LENGTH=31 /DNA_ID= /DNA_START= /DNA_END= /DNA_ORIENTATION=